MKKIVTLLGLISYGAIFAQAGNVGINTATPNANAVLDVVSTNRGFLPPRIALTSTASPSPLTAHVAGMVVYNTATAGAGPTAVVPALYYNDGTQWVLSKGGAASATTNILGSSGNTITSTVNGVASTAPAVNANILSLSGSSLTSVVNGISSTPLNLAPAIAAATTHTLSMSGNTLTSNVNGIAPTASVITSNTLTKPTTNTLNSTVNGIAATPDVTLVSSVNNTLSGTLLSTTVNGVTGGTIDLSGLQKNIYNSDGTLTANRTVTMAGKTLNFSGGASTERVGIGGIDPFAKLNVEGFIQFASDTNYGVGHIFNDATGEKYGLTQTSAFADGGGSTRIYTSGAGTKGNITFGKYTSASAYTSWVLIDTNGRMGIGTTAPTSLLSVNGTADKPGGGSWGTFSDRRVKKDIVEFKDGLNVINKLNPVTYRYNEKSGYKDLDKKYVGFIAQDVEKAAPYMVNIVDDTKKSGLKDKRELDESALTKILVNAVKEQQKEIVQLRKEIEDLKKRKK